MHQVVFFLAIKYFCLAIYLQDVTEKTVRRDIVAQVMQNRAKLIAAGVNEVLGIFLFDNNWENVFRLNKDNLGAQS